MVTSLSVSSLLFCLFTTLHLRVGMPWGLGYNLAFFLTAFNSERISSVRRLQLRSLHFIQIRISTLKGSYAGFLLWNQDSGSVFLPHYVKWASLLFSWLISQPLEAWFPSRSSEPDTCWQTFLILPTCVWCWTSPKEEEEEKEEKQGRRRKMMCGCCTQSQRCWVWWVINCPPSPGKGSGLSPDQP